MSKSGRYFLWRLFRWFLQLIFWWVGKVGNRIEWGQYWGCKLTTPTPSMYQNASSQIVISFIWKLYPPQSNLDCLNTIREQFNILTLLSCIFKSFHLWLLTFTPIWTRTTLLSYCIVLYCKPVLNQDTTRSRWESKWY